MFYIVLNSCCGVERQRDMVSSNRDELQSLCDLWNSQMTEEQQLYCHYSVIRDNSYAKRKPSARKRNLK